MFLSVQNLIFLLVSFIIIGVLLNQFFPKKLKRKWHFIKEKILLMKSYWTFVFIFILFAGLGYYYIFSSNVPTIDLKNLYISTFNQILTLIFAIFVGYYAFLQVFDARLDKGLEKAQEHITSKEYERAISVLEDCIKINSSDFSAWSNLMECYLISKRFSIFNNKIELLEQEVKSPRDRVILHYLKSTSMILQEKIGEAKITLGELITYTKENPPALNSLRWNFQDVLDSENYNKLGVGTKKIFVNLTKYLRNELTIEEKNKFENKNYELS